MPSLTKESIDDDIDSVIESLKDNKGQVEAMAEADERDTKLSEADKIAEELMRMDATKKWDFVAIMDLVRTYKGLP